MYVLYYSSYRPFKSKVKEEDKTAQDHLSEVESEHTQYFLANVQHYC